MADEKRLKDLLKSIAAENYYDNPVVTVNIFTKNVDNFTSTLYNVTISASDKEDLQLFVKVAALSEDFRRDAFCKFFVTEPLFYTQIARTFDTIQDKYNLRGDERLIFPKFYGCNTKYLKETVVLENLEASGFKCFGKYDSIDWQFAAKAMEELAKFHAFSFGYAKENREASEKLLDKMKFELCVKREPLEIMWGKTVDIAIEVADEEYKLKLRRFFEECNAVERTWRYNQPLRCSVLAHGDYKKCNLMYKVCGDGELQVTIVDYQALQTSSVATDLISFIFLGSDEEFRRRHFDQLVQYYYGKLCEALQRFGIDPDTVYPKVDFDYEMKMVLPYGICLAATILPAVLTDPSAAPVVDTEFSLNQLAVAPSSVYIRRLNGILRDYTAWGIL